MFKEIGKSTSGHGEVTYNEHFEKQFTGYWLPKIRHQPTG